MRAYARLLPGIILAGFFIFLMHPVTVHAGSATGSFIDADGDGFDDNLVDSNNNSIPDIFERAADVQSTSILSSVATVSTDIFADQSAGSSVGISYKSHSEHFSSRLSGCLGLDKCRNDFESDFSSGMGFSLGSGGGCIGGVCF